MATIKRAPIRDTRSLSELLKRAEAADPSISRTAPITAYARMYAGMPFADAIATRLLATYPLSKTHEERARVGSFVIEARSKAIDSIFLRYGTKSVFELASGFSPRGMELSEKVTYLETDLPGMITAKEKLVLDILGSTNAVERLGLRFESLDVFNRAEMELLALTIPSPITFISEGLITYLTHQETALVANNIRHVLSKTGGVWISSDFRTKEQLAAILSLTQGESSNTINQLSTRDTTSNAFEDFKAIKRLFDSAGLSGEALPIYEFVSADQLKSVEKNAIPLGYVRRVMSHYIYLLRCSSAQET